VNGPGKARSGRVGATVAGAAAWGLAAYGAVYGFSSTIGCLAAAVGAILASVMCGLLNSGTGTSTRWSLLRLRNMVVLLLVVILLAEGLIYILQSLWNPFSVLWALLIIEVIDLGAKAFVLVFVLRCLSVRFRWAVGLEGLVAVIAFTRITAAHRIRQMRPFWLVDYCLEHGIDQQFAFWWVGVCALLVFVLIVFSRRLVLFHSFWKRVRASVALLFLIAVVLFVTRYFSPPPFFMPPPPPPSQQSSASQPPPPSPPPPEPVALVCLQDCYFPPERLSAYYLREESFSQTDGYDLIKGSTSGVPWEGWNAIPASNWCHPEHIFDQWQSDDFAQVTTRTFYFQQPEIPLALISPVKFQTISSPDTRFAYACEIVSVPPGLAADDLNLRRLSQSLRDPAWSEEAYIYYTHAPTNQAFRTLSDTVLNAVSARRKKYLPARANALTTWINTKWTLSAEAGARFETNSIESFLFGDQARIGGARQFAHGAVLLLRALGVPARLTHGYRYGVSDRENKSELLITSSHRAWWAEVYLDGSGWLPMTFNPTNILDRAQPPPEHDLEEEMARMTIEEEDPLRDSFWGVLAFSLQMVVSLVMLVLLIFILRRIVWCRLIRPTFCRDRVRHRVCLRAAMAMLGDIRERRRYGETWQEFSSRLGRDNDGTMDRRKTAIIAAFSVLTGMLADDYETSLIEDAGRSEFHDRCEWIRVLRRLSRAVTVYALFKKSSQFGLQQDVGVVSSQNDADKQEIERGDHDE